MHDELRRVVGKTNFRSKNTRRVTFKQSGGETRDRQFNNKSQRKLTLVLQTLDDSDNEVHFPNEVHLGGSSSATSGNRQRRSSLRSAENGANKMRTLVASTSEWFQVTVSVFNSFNPNLLLLWLRSSLLHQFNR